MIEKRLRMRINYLGGISPPRFDATVVLLVGFLVTAGLIHGETAESVIRLAAMGTGASLVASILCDLKTGVRALIRADTVMLLSLYYMTFFEFLFPQTGITKMLDAKTAKQGCLVVLLAISSLSIGRHLAFSHRTRRSILTKEVSTQYLLLLFWMAMAFGYLHMLIAVDFNPVAMVKHFFGGRFSVPWARGRYGNWNSLLNEIGAILFLVPPLAGVVIMRYRMFKPIQVATVLAGLLLTLAYGFFGGTRFVFAAYLVTFIGGAVISSSPTQRSFVLSLGAGATALLVFHTTLATEFRQTGFSRYYARPKPSHAVQNSEFTVDRNIYPISLIVKTFPKQHEYLGLEVPFWMLVRPVPRALWPGKPHGLSVSAAEVIGVNADTVTIATTFIGEAYMCFGPFMVLVAGLAMGGMSGWWSRLASGPLSAFGSVVYASGLYAAAVSMRSIQELPVVVLPTFAAIILLRLASSNGSTPSVQPYCTDDLQSKWRHA